MNKKIVDYKEMYNQYLSLTKEMRIIIRDNILACFKKAGVQELEFKTDIVEPFCISYDGGNHPEYASNVCSEVKSIRVNEKEEISVVTEDGLMWFDNMEFVDIVEVERNLVENLDAIMENMGLTKTKEEN